MFNVRFKSWLNQPSLSHESNEKAKKSETKIGELIESENGPEIPEIHWKMWGDYGGKDLRKR